MKVTVRGTALLAVVGFIGTDIDVLVVGNAYLEKPRQPEHLKSRYEDNFALD